MNASPLDGIAFNHLFDGNAEMAKSIWEKKDNVSSLQNRIVLALVKGNTSTAVKCAEILYTRFEDEFIHKVVGEGFAPDQPLWQIFLDSLLEAGVNAMSIAENVTIREWKAYISQKTITPLIDSITNAITIAKSTKGKGFAARLQAGQKLMSSTKSALSQLKKILPSSDIRYQTIADKLATEILQCGIDYYNDSDDDDSPQQAMKLQKYAYSIAVGSMAKQRCKENVDILQNIMAQLPPVEVIAQYRIIQEELRKFCSLPDKIDHAITLITNTKPHLQKMRNKLGVNNSAYLKISTQVVGNALHNVIEEVNEVQKDETIAGFPVLLDRDEKIAKIKSALQKAWKATLLMDKFDMEADFKITRYTENRRILKNMCEQLGVSTLESPGRRIPSYPPSTSWATSQPTSQVNIQRTPPSSDNDDFNWGVFITIVVAVIILYVICTMING